MELQRRISRICRSHDDAMLCSVPVGREGLDNDVMDHGVPKGGTFSRMLLSYVAAFRSARSHAIDDAARVDESTLPASAERVESAMQMGMMQDDQVHASIPSPVIDGSNAPMGWPPDGGDEASMASLRRERIGSSVEEMTNELKAWRNAFTVKDAQIACRTRGPSWSMGVFCSGGCLDTLAGIRSGFTPVWSTEIHTGRANMFEQLTGSPCLGDTFGVDFTKQYSPIVLWSGQPCPDYSSSHAGRQPPGSAGQTGWQFVAQADKVLEADPTVCVMEMVPNALWLQDGSAVHELILALNGRYRLFMELVKVAEHGDASARERLLIVGFHRKKVGVVATSFRFPRPTYDDMHYHTAINIAVPDEEVPDGYWRHDRPQLLPVTAPIPLTMHKIARSGPGMGYSELPSLVQGWGGLINTQTTHNGGGRRPALSWRPGQPLHKTRLTVPVETVRAASLPDDYLDWCMQFNGGTDGEGARHLRECVNMGVPVRTACAVNECIRVVLLQAGVPFDIRENTLLATAEETHLQLCAHNACELSSDPMVAQTKVKKIRVDTGATATFMFTDIEPFLEDNEPANCTIAVAKKDAMLRGHRKGKLRAHVLNLSAYSSLPAQTSFVMHPTTVPGLSQELLSLDDYYRHGRYNIFLRQPDYQDGISELYRAPSHGIPEARVPLSYDWQGAGGWWLHYVPAVEVDVHDMELCAMVMQEDVVRQSQAVRDQVERAMHDVSETVALHSALVASSNVREVLSRNGDETGVENSPIKHTTDEVDDTSSLPPEDTDRASSVDKRHMIIASSSFEREILGVKEGMRTAFKRMKRRDFHERFSHMGVLPSGQKCRICQMAKGVARRIFTRVDPFKETRVGHKWAMDGITFSHRSKQGCKYMIVVRDMASGAFQFMPLYRKSDVVQAFKDWVQHMRNNPLYACMPYHVVSSVRLDNEGSWKMDNTAWQEMLTQIHPTVELHYVCPDRHAQENGYAESACRIAEITVKQILLAQNLGPEFWQDCSVDAQWLLNRFPSLGDEYCSPPDGDKARPLELLTRGYLSRREIDRQLSYYVAVGTPALVHEPIKGSFLGPKTRWGIACGMYRDQPTWKCPYNGSTFRSKSYTAYRLREGLNYFQFLKLPYRVSTQAQMRLPEEANDDEAVICHLPQMTPVDARDTICVDVNDYRMQRSTSQVPEDLSPQGGTGPTVIDSGSGRHMRCDPQNGRLFYDEVQETTRTTQLPRKEGDPVFTVEIPEADESEDGTDVEDQASDRDDAKEVRNNIHQVNDDEEKSDEYKPQDQHHQNRTSKRIRTQAKIHNVTRQEPVRRQQKKKAKASRKQITNIDMSDWESCIVDLATDMQAMHMTTDDVDVETNWTRAAVAGIGKTLKNVIKGAPYLSAKVPYEMIPVYREWLIECHQYSPTDIPLRTGKGKPKAEELVKPGTRLPLPGGDRWRTMLGQYSNKYSRRHDIDEITKCIEEQASLCHVEQRLLECFRGDMKKVIRSAVTKKAKREKAVAVGHDIPPKSFKEAFSNHPKDMEWIKSANTEMQGLSDNEVVDHDYTLEMLEQAGVPVDPQTGTVHPINLSIVLDHKYTDGILSKYKTRMAVAGHSGNLRRGEHFDKTFAASPNANSSRILQALMVTRRWFRKAFDINQAYVHAPLPPGRRIALKYPDGFKRYDEQGRELYMLLMSNLYGHPAASRAWSQHRDEYMLQYFNKPDGPWTCTRCRMDPCLFRFTRCGKNGEPDDEAIALIYTDDCDVIGSSQAILDEIFHVINERWGAKEVGADFVLGVKRDSSVNEKTGEHRVELTMTAFIDGMIEAFKDELDEEPVDTPFPPKVVLSKFGYNQGSVSPEEVQKYLDKGYMRAVGMLLWAQRQVFAECAVGVSMLCRVMSCPNEESWRCAMHMMKWLRSQRNRGLVYSSLACSEPIAFSDASNDSDPVDGKCQYGYCIMMSGGPVIYQSKKLGHVSPNGSASHCEYMALCHCNQSVVWLRQLLLELDCGDLIMTPTVVYGDNKQANNLVDEDIVTSGNQYIYLPYHYNKEVSEQGFVSIRDIRTAFNVADLFTKPVTRDKIQALAGQLLGYQPIPYDDINKGFGNVLAING